MLFIDRAEVQRLTPWTRLVDAIADALTSPSAQAPQRQVLSLDGEGDGGMGRALLLMPSWDRDLVALKTVTYFPNNAGTEVPTVNAAVLLFRGDDGRHVATIDGDELTARRTAAIAALACRRLARADASRLLVVGTGQLAPNMARAHAALRVLEQVEIWGRRPEEAERVASDLKAEGIPAVAVDDLDRAVSEADIVSCVTGATSPLLNGRALQPGVHLELIGSFAPAMREADDAAVSKASIFVDTFAGAEAAGDLAQPLEAGVISRSDIKSDLRGLVVGDHVGRSSADEITLFKSAGFALADLAAARLAWRSASE